MPSTCGVRASCRPVRAATVDGGGQRAGGAGRAHARTSSWGVGVGGVPGEGEEDVVERRAAQRDVVERDARDVERADRGDELVGPGRDGHGDARARRRRPSPRRRAPRPRARAAAASRTRTSMTSRPARDLSSPAVPAATSRPWSMIAMWSARRSASSRYCVVSSDVGALGRERLDRPPQLVAAARVEAGGRLVEQQQARARRRGSRRGRAAGACRRSRCARAGRRRRRARAGRARRRRRAGSARRPWPKSRATMRRFSRPLIAGSTAAYWPARPMTRRTAVGMAGDVDAGDAQRARVGAR